METKDQLGLLLKFGLFLVGLLGLIVSIIELAIK